MQRLRFIASPRLYNRLAQDPTPLVIIDHETREIVLRNDPKKQGSAPVLITGTYHWNRIHGIDDPYGTDMPKNKPSWDVYALPSGLSFHTREIMHQGIVRRFAAEIGEKI